MSEVQLVCIIKLGLKWRYRFQHISEYLWTEGEVAAWRSIVAYKEEDKVLQEFTGSDRDIFWEEWRDHKYGCGYCEKEWYPLEKGVDVKQAEELPEPPDPNQLEMS
jgi:hypothetical protein